MKITIQSAMNIAIGLRSLDGYDYAVGDRVIKKSYKLGGKMRTAIGKSLHILDARLNILQKSTNDLIRQLSDGGNSVAKDKTGEFLVEQNAMLEAEEEFDLAAISIEGLNLEENPIPGTVLSLLHPILED